MSLVEFTCNVCGAACRAPIAELRRETPSCDGCGSTVRLRSLTHLLPTALFGTGLALPEVVAPPGISVVGLSDPLGYSAYLEGAFEYTNTFLHDDPRLDVTAVPQELAAAYDVVISSDVFEHVLPPAQRAFDGAARLLKPGGHLVLTVPWSPRGSTVEHYPGAVGYAVIAGNDEGYEVEVQLLDGTRYRAETPVFHGGPGLVLEMRVFSYADLLDHLADAGFTSVRVLRGDVPEFGIFQHEEWSLAMLATLPPESPE